MLKLKIREKEINFYERYFYDPEAEARKRFVTIAVIPLAALLLIILGIFGFLKISDAMHKHEINQIEEYLNSTTISQKYTQSTKLQKENDDLSSTYSSMNDVITKAKELPDMDSLIMGRINSALKGSKVVSHAYNAGQGTFVIVASTSTASAVPGLIRQLKSVGCFSTVSYTGYQDSDSKYVATISCVMFK